MTNRNRKHALIVGPLAESSRVFARALFSAGLDPHRLGGVLRIGVDGGLLMMYRLGIKPHLAVGDWDSLPAGKIKTELKGVLHLSLPQKKDRSDLFYACRAAVSAGATDLICMGVMGGRSDHHLGMIYDLSEVQASESALRSVVAADSHGRYHFISSHWEGKVRPGQLVSVFSLGGTAQGVSLDGFEYRLRNAELKPSSHGLSNRAKRSHLKVSVKKGRLIVMVIDS